MSDATFMELALAQARKAAAAGEIPVGAVVVRHGHVIASGRNAPIDGHDPTAHAEIAALRAAALARGNYRLDDCELFVTLEPCAMCSGAMLHARLKRVVFGASDPKTGAAGSVINLFAHPQLNHQTELQGGVLAEKAGALLQDFFRQRRADKREASRLNHPLRDDALRTPDSAFEGLPAYPWQPRYLSDLPALAGLRMHYLDEPGCAGQGSPQPLTYLCLHGNSDWSYSYRKMIPTLLGAGHRVVAPDLPGFGKSDKPKKESFHSFSRHRQMLLELVERLDLQNIVLVIHDSVGLLGLALLMAAPQRFRGLLAINTAQARGNPQLGTGEPAAYNAPFLDKGHRAALRAFPSMRPEGEAADDEGLSSEAFQFWRERWTGQALVLLGAQDPVPAPPEVQELREFFCGSHKAVGLEPAGHSSQEPGEQVARHALRFFHLPA